MATIPDNTLRIERGSRGARITLLGYDPQTGAPMSMSSEFGKEKTRRVVDLLCKAAGLPEPWARR